MSKTWNQTRVATALGVQYPIIQGPLGGFSTQRLTAAVSNFGALGSFGAHGFQPRQNCISIRCVAKSLFHFSSAGLKLPRAIRGRFSILASCLEFLSRPAVL